VLTLRALRGQILSLSLKRKRDRIFIRTATRLSVIRYQKFGYQLSVDNWPRPEFNEEATADKSAPRLREDKLRRTSSENWQQQKIKNQISKIKMTQQNLKIGKHPLFPLNAYFAFVGQFKP
jgi:hypothetical protein